MCPLGEVEQKCEGDRRERESRCHENRHAIQILFDHGRTGGRRTESSAEHVGEATALAAMKQDKKRQSKAEEHVEHEHDPKEHGCQTTAVDTECSARSLLPTTTRRR